MSRIYDVVCPRCGEIMQWCKYDPPIEKCTFCGYRMARRDRRGELHWKDDVLVFGVGSTSLEVREESERRRRQFFEERRYMRFKTRSGLWCTVKMRTPLTFELRFNIRGRRIILLCESTRLGDAVSFLRDYGFVPPFMLAEIEYEGEAYSPSKREILDAVAENEIPELLALIK